MKNKKIILLTLLVFVFVGFAVVADANHSWGKYHWDLSTADTEANPLELGDNLTTAAWDSALSGASSDWNDSVLKNAVAVGQGGSNCDPTSGRVEVCNDEYGNNGWLGIASIWATRGKENHIVQGVVQVNDTYFNSEPYNTSAWRNMVMCQEVGHTFGLDHQDEDFYNANLGTCMDYTSDPDGSINGQLDNQHPNTHDYDMMEEIYAHLNSSGEGGGPGNGKGGGNGGGNGGGKGKPADVGAGIDLTNPSSWGQVIREDAQGNASLFMRELPNGQVLITHVLWVE